MSPSANYTEQPWLETYSEIVDVRSPTEFAADHILGALNLPVLTDLERARVGTLYKQSSFEARKLGAALVAQNISHHLQAHFSSKAKDYHPLVYCWRGGQRSQSMAIVLTQVGWPVTLLQGGYKTYRTYVREQLEHLPATFSYQVLSGLTGTGKTHILHQLADRGAQVLDLEGLANHRGSLLGEQWQANQPSQKYFESLLLQKLQSFNSTQPVWVEAESSKIGRIYLPVGLWQSLSKANTIELQLPLACRVDWLLQDYPHLVAHPDLLKEKLQRLRSYYGQERLSQWFHLIDTEQWQRLVADLLEKHYDPSYCHGIQRSDPQVKKTVFLPDLSQSSISALIDKLLKS